MKTSDITTKISMHEFQRYGKTVTMMRYLKSPSEIAVKTLTPEEIERTDTVARQIMGAQLTDSYIPTVNK